MGITEPICASQTLHACARVGHRIQQGRVLEEGVATSSALVRAEGEGACTQAALDAGAVVSINVAFCKVVSNTFEA